MSLIEPDENCTIERLLCENAQLREELTALRNDYEHLLDIVQRLKIEAMT